VIRSTLGRQRAAMRFIHGYQLAHGFSPSFREIAAALGVDSKSIVSHVLDDLEKAGALRRLPQHHRAIELLDVPAIPRAPDGAPLFAVPGAW
jgi:SOS-response transcriptional repressor LexA